METPTAHDERTTVAPPAGTPEHAEYLYTLDQIAQLNVFREYNVRGIECLQAQIAGFCGDSSYYALVALGEQVASRARVVAQQENELCELHRKLNDLRNIATYRLAQAPKGRRRLFTEVVAND